MASVDFEFSFNEWMATADRRLNTRLEKSKSTEEVDEAYALYVKDVGSVCSLQKLVSWAESRRIRIEFKTNATDAYGQLLVTLNKRHPYQEQVIYILHELGHALIGANNKTYVEKFPYGYNRDVTQKVEKITERLHRVDVVTEECEAWARGLKLAKKLGLNVDRKKFELCRLQSLRSYFKWAIKK